MPQPDGVCPDRANRDLVEDFWSRSGEKRKLTLVLDERVDVVEVLEQLPTVTVYLDAGAREAGPGSGPVYIFFVTDGVAEAELDASINALAHALRSDIATLESGAPSLAFCR